MSRGTEALRSYQISLRNSIENGTASVIISTAALVFSKGLMQADRVTSAGIKPRASLYIEQTINILGEHMEAES
jgi:hypothetical protein